MTARTGQLGQEGWVKTAGMKKDVIRKKMTRGGDQNMIARAELPGKESGLRITA
jgi:hypothetical protein